MLSGGYKPYSPLIGLPLSLKLSLIMLCGAVPVLLLGRLYHVQVQKEINHAANEINGTAYMGSVWSNLIRIAKSGHSIGEVVAEDIEAMTAHGEQHDGVMQTAAQAGAFKQAMKKGATAAGAVAAGIVTIQKIGDGSGLFLDPELHTVYLMDTVVQRLTELISAAHTALQAAETVAQNPVATFDEKTALILALGRLDGVTGMISGNYQAAYDWNPDGIIKSALSTAVDKHLAAAIEYQNAVRGFASDKPSDASADRNMDHLNSAYSKLIDETDALWRATTAMLKSLIEARHAELNSALMSQIGTLLVALGLVFVLVTLVSYSIQRPLTELTAIMARLRKGEFAFDVPYIAARNEIGDVARSLEASRAAQVELAGARSTEETRSIKDAAEFSSMQIFLANLKDVISAVRRGDFSVRMREQTGSQYGGEIAAGLNEITTLVERGVGETVNVVGEVINGNLSARMTGSDYAGSFFILKTNVNAMGDRIREIAYRISGATDTLQVTSAEIANGVADLSVRTEQQASALEETSASMEEMSATVRQTAGKAQEANISAVSARDLAVGGGAIASQAIAAMSKIESSSQKISEIVGLIEEIAFQTNILALNAAVEAARAGDAGKGFAVVASEVRSLSQRSAAALKDVKALIVNSDSSVKEGVELVSKAGKALTDIATSVRTVADFVADIASANQEQASGVDQVNRAVTGMEQLTQQNAALVEETSSALQSAQTQVEELRAAVAFFRTGEAGPSVRPATPRTHNPVHHQQGVLARKIGTRRAGASATAATAGRTDWIEF